MKDIKVCAVGSLVRLIICEIEQLPCVNAADDSVSAEVLHNTIGTDAPIFCTALSELGVASEIRCNPVGKSGRPLIGSLGSLGINCTHIELMDIEMPTTIVLRDKSDRKLFITKKSNNELINVSNIDAEFIYMDFYDENIELFSQLLQKPDMSLKRLYLNFSSTSIIEKIGIIDKLDMNIDVIQFSSKNLGESIEILKNSFGRLKCNAMVATCGRNGSMIISKDGLSHAKSAFVSDRKKIVGAGAYFSAAFIHSLLSGNSYTEANHLACEYVAELCCKRDSICLLRIE